MLLFNGHDIPAYTAVFDILNLSTLTVTESLFEIHQGRILVVLSANLDIKAIFDNSTFNRITNCDHNAQQCSGNSSLVLEGCLYSDNNMSSHLVASNDTKAAISNCRFANNLMIEGAQKDLMGLLVVDRSMADINNCTFTNNLHKVTRGSLIPIGNSNITINGTVFHNNTYDINVAIYDIYVILVKYTRNLTVTNSVFIGNYMDYNIFAVSENINVKSYLILHNCSFNENFSTPFYTENIRDILVYGSYFHLDVNIGAKNALAVRLWNSVFNGSDNIMQFFSTVIVHSHTQWSSSH